MSGQRDCLLPPEIARLDYEIQLYSRAVREKVQQVLDHPDDWDVSECYRCGIFVVTIPSGEPVFCNKCVEAIQ